MFTRLKRFSRILRNSIWYINNNIYNFRYDFRRQPLEDKILHCKARGVTDERYGAHEVIVSLTTYGKRLRDVCFTIESIMQQTMLPNRIILNLDEGTLAKHLPIALRKQIERGLTVKEVKDIKSYKKLIPTLKEYPEAIIITVDDDAIYEFDIIERLYDSYLAHPHNISALRTHTIILGRDGKPKKYKDWKLECDEARKPGQLFFTGVGGVLYPPHAFDSEVFNEEVFTAICGNADDVWFHAMALKNGTTVVKVPTRNLDGCDYACNENVQDNALWNRNMERGENDRQMKAVFDRYGLYELLR